MRKGLIILGDLKDQDLIWMAEAGTLQEVSTGQTLITEGARPEHLFIITEGWFDVVAQGAPVSRVTTGDVLGEMSFVEKQGASATVRATEPARVLAVPQAALLERFAEDQGFAARFYRALAVFLSDRLRSQMEGEASQELDEGLLDTLHVAGDRMLRLISLLEGRGGPA